MALSGWSTTPGSNATVGSINWAEGMAPASVNDSARQMMTDNADWYRNSAEWIARGDTAVYVGATQFKFAGSNKTSVYSVGRRVKLVATTPGTIYGTITVSSFSTDTTITVSWDSGSLANEAITSVAVGIIKGGTTSQSISVGGLKGMSTFSAATVGSTSLTAWQSALGIVQGPLVLLQTQTASNSASIAFNATYLTTTYKKYIFDFIDIVMASDGVDMHMVVSEDNGSNYKTTNEYYWSAIESISSSATPISTPGSGVGSIVISPVSLIGNGTGRSFNGTVVAFNPLGTTLHKMFMIDTGCQDNGGATGNRKATGYYSGTVNAINNIKFLSNSGNITSGTIKLYGVS